MGFRRPLTFFEFSIFYLISIKPRNYTKRNENFIIILQHFQKNLIFPIENLCKFFKIFLPFEGGPAPNPLQERCSSLETWFSSQKISGYASEWEFKRFLSVVSENFERLRGLHSRSQSFCPIFNFLFDFVKNWTVS